MIDKRLLKNLDWGIITVTLAILIFGCISIYSASEAKWGANLVIKQLIWTFAGVAAAAGISTIDQQFFVRNKKIVFWIMIILLVLVYIFGDSAKGAQRWLEFGSVKVQPSEFAKIFVILCLAGFLTPRSAEIKNFKTFMHSLLYLTIPIVLIFKQPDLGTSLVIMAIWLTMTFVAGTDYKNILIFFSIGTLLFSAAWFTPGFLKPYQKQRLINTFNPNADPLKSGYHAAQSRIAIGSGQITGKGYLSGTQRKLAFIPEQHTDFIFTVVAEEIGFVGGAALIFMYLFLIVRTLMIAAEAEDFTAKVIAAGVAGMFMFHIFVNLGMTLGIMPVTGVPLPLFSYGGSSMMTSLMAIGLLEGVAMRRHHINF